MLGTQEKGRLRGGPKAQCDFIKRAFSRASRAAIAQSLVVDQGDGFEAMAG
jgi:hypothetical protein